MEERIYSFGPIIKEGAKLLILGTMPSIKSLEHGINYAHDRNAFWPIMYSLLGQEINSDSEKRRELLWQNNIALWDVLESCNRIGSLDSDITNPKPNDIPGLVGKYPTIKAIFFNGNNAYLFYKRFIGKPSLPFTILPSTSPANARLGFMQKLSSWRVLLEHL